MDLRDLQQTELRRFEPVEFQSLSEDRTIEFPFSSELPVTRWWGDEVLDHSPKSVDLARLQDGAPVLFNHDLGRPIGVVERAWIDEAKRRGMVRVRFSKSEQAQQVVADIEDRILRNISFGYTITAAEQRGEQIVATQWVPHEVSVVTVPADPTVGIGRSLDAAHSAQAPAAATPTPSPIPMEIESPNLAEVRAQAAAEERTRVAEITKLCRQHEIDPQDLIERGASEADAMKQVLSTIAERAKQPATPKASPVAPQPVGSTREIGLTEKEKQSYSFLRAIRAQAFPNDRKAWDAAGFEREVSEAVQSATGRQARGFLVPHEVMTRDLTVGTATGAGDLVFTDARPGSFIEVLRNRLALTTLGVQMLTGLEGPVAIPRQTGQASTSWVGEGVDVSESQPTVDQINLTPKTLGAFTEFSRRLILQASMDVEQMVRTELATVIALEIDRAALYGLGNTSQPMGLKRITGINTEDFGAAQPTYAELVSMETKINADNADLGAMAYITTSTIYGGFKTTEKATNTAQFVLEPGGTVNGYPVVRSNQVEAGDVFMGVWNQMIMAMWGALDLQVNPYALDKSGGVRVTALQDVDVAVRHPEAFCRGANTL